MRYKISISPQTDAIIFAIVVRKDHHTWSLTVKFYERKTFHVELQATIQVRVVMTFSLFKIPFICTVLH